MTGLATTANRERYDLIDLLRGIAILLVVVRHVQIRIPFEQTSFFSHLPELIFKSLFISGNEGVRIFFVISGFIITMTSLNRYSKLSAFNARQFYIYRFARIAPCLLGLLTILTILHFLEVKGYVINSKFTYLEALISALTFTLNWLEGTTGYLPPSWDVLWSLSVEEVFYLLFPVACLLLPKKEFVIALLILLIVVGPFNRYFLEGNKIWQSKAYLSCMDSIAIGCLFALISHNKKISETEMRAFSILGVSIVVFVLMFKRETFFPVLSNAYLYKTLLSLGVGMLLIVSVRHKINRVFRTLISPLRMYGKLSYEIYLSHSFVVLTGVSLYKKYQVNLEYAPIWLFGIIVLSGVLGHIIEKHFSSPANTYIRKRWNTA